MRQGCPLSPIIFALLIEPLVAALRAHQGIKSLNFQGLQHKISLFADNIILIVTDPMALYPSFMIA